MATRSLIALETAKGNITKAIYCHWNGYPDYQLDILESHYTKLAKVKELLALGDISVLAPLVSPPEACEHSFETPHSDTTVAYHRDRGDEFDAVLAKGCLKQEKLCVIAKDCYCEYVYIFNQVTKTWRYVSI